MDTLARIKELATKELSLDPAKLDPNAPLADLERHVAASLQGAGKA